MSCWEAALGATNTVTATDQHGVCFRVMSKMGRERTVCVLFIEFGKRTFTPAGGAPAAVQVPRAVASGVARSKSRRVRAISASV